MPIQPLSIRGEEDRPFARLADHQVHRAGGPRREGNGDDLAALACDGDGPVPAFQAQRLDVRAGGLRHPQPVQGEERDQGMPGGGAEPGGDQQCAYFVAVKAGRVRLIAAGREQPWNGLAVLPRWRTGRTWRSCTAGA